MAGKTPPTPLEYFNAGAPVYEGNAGGCTRDLAEIAVDLIQELKPITPDSEVLDNACGTGIVTDVLLASTQSLRSPPDIHAVDGAENMIRIASERFPHPNVHASTMPGETLSFPDDTFSHSITNVGLMFFEDAVAGAKEILRTLQPGGVAIITGWKDLGWVEVIRGVYRALRPNEPPFKIPVRDEWLEPLHTKRVLEEAGFENVEVLEKRAYMGDRSAEDVVDLLMRAPLKLTCDGWSEEERGEAARRLLEVVREVGVSFERQGQPGFGIKMVGTVFVCRKD
ncbi:Methyltransferase tpcH [Paramyrothecium foliicola]|nr:Methyltransferase tpcH [Paramyrothecium foliicola]